MKSNPMKVLVDRIVHRGLESFGRHYSTYRGYVLDNRDQTGLNKLFVYVPHISGLKKQGNWAYPKAVPNELNLLPKIGDMVWVEFEHGDYRYPVWTYSNQIQEVRKKTNPVVPPGDLKWKTERGHEIWIKDQEDEVHVKHSNGTIVKIDNEGVNIDVIGKLQIKNEDSDLKVLLNELLTELINLRIQTGVGPGFPEPLHIVKFNEILSDINKLMK